MADVTPAAAPSEAPAVTQDPGPLGRFLALWHDTNDEPYGLVYAVTEVFPEPLVADLKTQIAALPAAIRAGRAQSDPNADRAIKVLVGLLGCLRGGVLDIASDALVAVGPDALPALDGARTFGYEVDMKDGRNTLVLFGDAAVWEKMVRKTAMLIDPKRGNVVTRLLAKIFT